MFLTICHILKDSFIFVHIQVCVSACTCMPMQRHVNVDSAQEAKVSHQIPSLLLSICSFEAGSLFLNMEFTFSQIVWKTGSPRNPIVSFPPRIELPSIHRILSLLYVR